MSNVPLPDEERAALEKRLEELKAKKEQQQAGQAPPKHEHQDPEGDNDEDEEVEENLDDGDAFFENVSKNHRNDEDDNMQVIATDKDKVVKRAVGDFELLRLAKMGDLESMLQFSKVNHENLSSFEDNKARNALHYAADSGNRALIETLGELRVPYKADEKGLTPLAIAVLNQCSEEAIHALQNIASRSHHADANTIPDYYKVLEQFAPEPPRFVLSKPTPSAAAGGASRLFWGSKNVTTADGVELTTTTLETEGEAEVLKGELQELGQEAVGLRGWLPAAPHGRKHITVVKAKENGHTVATVAAAAMKGSLKGFGKKLNSIAIPSVAVANYLAVHPSKRGTTLTPSILHQLQQSMAGTDAICFASNVQLPTPPTATCAIKWFQRVLLPQAAHQSDCAEHLFADYYEYDTVLKADTICRNAIQPAQYKQYDAQLPGWTAVEPHSEDQMQHLLQFLQSNLNDSTAELAYLPSCVEDLQEVLDTAETRAFVWSDDNSSIKDVVVFHVRRSGATDQDPLIAQVVFALFTDKTAVQKVDHMVILAERLLRATALYIPTLFGITDSDLVKGRFEEVSGSREFLYIVSQKDTSHSLVPATPAAKTFPPVYLF